jgi:hypothetical protein
MLLAGAVMVAALALAVPAARRWNQEPAAPDGSTENPKVEQALAGHVMDEHGEPLAGVTVSIDELELADTTNARGHFRIVGRAEKQQRVEVMAQKDGYATYSDYATFGAEGLSFTMKKK